VVAALLAALGAPAPLVAQPTAEPGSPRLSVSVIGTYRAASTLLGEDFVAPASGPFAASGHTTRLRLDGAWMPGMRVEYRVRGGWRLFGEAASGGAGYRYLSRWWVGEAERPSGVTENTMWGPARAWSASAGLAHAVTPRWRGALVEVEAGATFQRDELPDDRGCVRTAARVWCPAATEGLAVRWDPRFDVPGGRAGVTVRQRVLPRLELQARGGYAVGRLLGATAATAVPAGGDAARWVRTRQLSGGVALGF
jgi:hypothetical protein